MDGVRDPIGSFSACNLFENWWWPPEKLTYSREIDAWKMKFLSKWFLFRGHVNFWGWIIYTVYPMIKPSKALGSHPGIELMYMNSNLPKKTDGLVDIDLNLQAKIFEKAVIIRRFFPNWQTSRSWKKSCNGFWPWKDSVGFRRSQRQLPSLRDGS